jgi:hypothetical protein
VRRILERTCPLDDLAEASLACALGCLLEQVGRWDGGTDLGALNTATAVLHRLIASCQQVEELRRRLEPLPAADGCPDGGISEPALRQLEERLQLL